jgi:hypothetical protein
MAGNSAKLKALAYGRFEVKSIPDWRVFLDIMYGLELKPAQRRGEFEVVIDDAGSRLLFAEGPADDLVANGWLCDDLDDLKDRIDAVGGRAEWASDEEAKDRGAGRLLRTVDPFGLIIEAVDTTSSVSGFAPPKHDHVFKTGDLGVGHFTFQANDVEVFERFYVDALGMEVTDYNQLTPWSGLLNADIRGVGPNLGRLGAALRKEGEKNPEMLEIFGGEMNRLCGVIDRILENGKREYLTGDYSIGDIMHFPWLRIAQSIGANWVVSRPRVVDWLDRIAARPAVERGMAIPN